MGNGRIASPVLALAMGLDFGLILGLAGVEGVEHGGADQRPHRPRQGSIGYPKSTQSYEPESSQLSILHTDDPLTSTG
ncbi:hypothetical protein B296_00013510 [Ensete ventricosum]|uniref:Uncharacterized protein n=1 Tax=Ensete ventricosum TaxID=4639 RepID=A0A427AMK0_ENSVE|nr:hypothetical protein B296_00013510 [Ensete ventricosum]